MDKIKLLFVTYDEDNAFIIKIVMEQINNYDIRIACNGKESIDIYKSFEPDIIVADTEMSIMDGKEMVRLIREIYRYVPVIYLNSHREYLVEVMEADANVFLQKPITAKELDVQIRALLKYVSYKQLPVMGNDEYVIGTFGFNPSRKYLSKNGIYIELSNTEVSILDLLVRNKGLLVRREVILNYLDTTNQSFSSRSLDVFYLPTP